MSETNPFNCPPSIFVAIQDETTMMLRCIKRLGPERVQFQKLTSNRNNRAKSDWDCDVAWLLDGQRATLRMLLTAWSIKRQANVSM